MTTEAKQAQHAVRELHQLQAKQIRKARKLSRLRDRLEMRSRRFQQLEADLVALEQRAFNAAAQPAVGAALSKYRRPAWLVVNPTSGGLSTLAGSPENLVTALRAHGSAPEVYIKTSGKEMRAWVRAAVKEGAPLVIAAGGDGTLVDVASQLVGSDTVLGILPTGTMNNIARELGIPLDLDQACALIGAGITRPLDVGRIRSSKQSKAHYFLETAGVGLAVALPAGQHAKKGRWGKLIRSLQEMFAPGPEPIIVELDNGLILETKVRLVTVSNAPLYGLNNLIAPDAKMDDGLFDVAIYDGMTDLELAGYFVKTGNAQRVTNPNVRFFRARRVQIRSAHDLPVTSDNEQIASRPVIDIDMQPYALKAIVGKGAALAWPVEAVSAVPPLAGKQAAPKVDSVIAENGHQPDSDTATVAAKDAPAEVSAA